MIEKSLPYLKSISKSFETLSLLRLFELFHPEFEDRKALFHYLEILHREDQKAVAELTNASDGLLEKALEKRRATEEEINKFEKSYPLIVKIAALIDNL